MIDWLAKQLDESQRKFLSDAAYFMIDKVPATVKVNDLWMLLYVAVVAAAGSLSLAAVAIWGDRIGK